MRPNGPHTNESRVTRGTWFGCLARPPTSKCLTDTNGKNETWTKRGKRGAFHATHRPSSDECATTLCLADFHVNSMYGRKDVHTDDLEMLHENKISYLSQKRNS